MYKQYLCNASEMISDNSFFYNMINPILPMKRNYFIAAIAALVMASCGNTQQKEDYSWIKTSLDRSASQLLLTAHEIDGTGKLPRSIHVGYDMDFLVRQ